MSDGPHRSLPMRRHWKDLAERAAKAAYSADQVCEALPYTLKMDLQECPLETIRELLEHEQSLFPEDRIEQLQAVRLKCRGSAASNILIDCAVEAVAAGANGEAAFRIALENTCDERARSGFRAVEEHYKREANESSARYVRKRLDTARRQCDFKAIASAFVTSVKPPRDSFRVPRQKGIDEGPAL